MPKFSVYFDFILISLYASNFDYLALSKVYKTSTNLIIQNRSTRLAVVYKNSRTTPNLTILFQIECLQR